MKHGISKYTSHGCRCRACRRAVATYAHRVRAERKKSLAGIPRPVRAVGRLPKDRPQHGLNSTYNNWGCRCKKCKRAHAVAARRARAML